MRLLPVSSHVAKRRSRVSRGRWLVFSAADMHGEEEGVRKAAESRSNAKFRSLFSHTQSRNWVISCHVIDKRRTDGEERC